MSTYAEPATIWRLKNERGDRARATLIPGSPASTLCFFVNDELTEGENFEEWAAALTRADEVRTTLLGEGWRADE